MKALEFIKLCISKTSLDKDYVKLINSKELASSIEETIEIFKTDLARYNMELDFDKLLFYPYIQAIFFYRLCHNLFLKKVELLPDVLAVVSRHMSGMEIYYSAEIGPGLKVVHGLGTVIGARSKIGSNFTIYQGVTIGSKGGKQAKERPVIGDYVIVSTGAQVLGLITVGNKVIVGANSVLLKSVPSNCVVAGIPAEIKKENLSDQAFYDFYNSI